MPHLSEDPCILCVAITGAHHTKAQNPALPITVAEQIESAHGAFEAGATVCHVHVRNNDGSPSSDPAKFARLKDGIETHCPGMVVQFSTSGRSGSGRARGRMLSLRPDMASLSMGTYFRGNEVYENPPQFIEWMAQEIRDQHITAEIAAYDLSHIFAAIEIHRSRLLYGRLVMQIVFGIPGALPPDKEVFDFLVQLIAGRAPDAVWFAIGIGVAQPQVNEWAIASGGHTRVGLEDNLWIDETRLAPSNAAHVHRAVQQCERLNRPVANVEQTRQILRLPPAPTRLQSAPRSVQRANR